MTTKLHAIVLEDRLPLIMTLTPGHWGDAPWGRWLLEQLGPISGQPQLIADRAYEGDAMRALAAELGWELITPPKSNRRKPWALKRAAYRAQWDRTLLRSHQAIPWHRRSLPQTRPCLLQPDPPRLHPLHDEIE